MWKVPHGVKLEQMKRPSLEKPIAALTGNDKKQEVFLNCRRKKFRHRLY